MLYRFGQDHEPSGPSRSGIEESGARTAADAKWPKSIVSEGAERPSLIDFSGAGAAVSLSLHSRDLFGSFFDLAKNEHPSLERGSLSCLWARKPWRKRWEVLRLNSQRRTACRDESGPEIDRCCVLHKSDPGESWDALVGHKSYNDVILLRGAFNV